MVQLIKDIDIGARCKHRTFRTVLRAMMDEQAESELKNLIIELDGNIKNDERFRKFVREAVKKFEKA